MLSRQATHGYSTCLLLNTKSEGQAWIVSLVKPVAYLSKSYNGISKWLRFGNEHAIVSSNDSVEQEKAIKYNTLLVNAVILQNLVDLSKIIKDLINQGIEIKMQDLKHLSPYKHWHIKRFGEYALPLSQKPAAIKECMGLEIKYAA